MKILQNSWRDSRPEIALYRRAVWRQPTGTNATQRYKTHCTGKLTHAARRF